MIEQLLAGVQTDIFAGGAALAVLGAAAYAGRSVFAAGLAFAQHRSILSVTITSHDPVFLPLMRALGRAAGSNLRRLKVDGGWRHDAPSMGPSKVDVGFGPGEGLHWIRFNGALVAVRREQRGGQEGAVGPFDIVSIMSLARDRQKVLDGIGKAALDSFEGRVPVYAWDEVGFALQREAMPRPLDSVIQKGDLTTSLAEDAARFVAGAADYAARGVPHRRGYLLEGPPGTGKSSLVLAIASHVDLPIYVINPSSLSDDRMLNRAFAQARGPCVVLVEDLDCTGAPERGARGKDASGVTLSGLLNAIDGVYAQEGRLLFITTNDAPRLDPALLRPGRIDVIAHIGLLDGTEIQRMSERFGLADQAADVIATLGGQATGAQVQAELMRRQA